MALIAEIPGAVAGQAVGLLAASYALGCLTLGYYFVRFATGKDVRQLGSGGVGAKNVGRELGPWGFAATLAGDAGKGALAVWAAERLYGADPLKLVAMIAVVAGHIWPVQLRFRGGKGMATAAGALIAFNPWTMAGLIAAFAAAFAASRNTVLAALAAFVLLPVGSVLLSEPLLNTMGFTALTALVLAAHRQNLREEFRALALAPKHKTTPSPTREKTL